MKRYVLITVVLVFGVFWVSQMWSGPRVLAHAQKASKAQAPTNEDCLACHSDASLTKEVDGQSVSLHVDGGHFAGSAHGSLTCISCHTDIKAVPHDPVAGTVDCAQCHADAVQAYNQGVHQKAIQRGNPKAAGCAGCHGSAHELLSSTDPKSKVNHANIAQTCGACHGVKFVMEGSGISSQPFFSYQESVHGRAVANGNEKAAACTDCHGNHDIRPASDEQSSIFRANVPRTCGACHQDVATAFNQSVHGEAVARGNGQAPVCTDCHGIHLIKAHIDPASSVAAQALARTTCTRCHAGMRLTQEFGIPGERVTSYLDSYHGLASQLGSNVVANCASCHGVHNILPSSDPKSTINPKNMAQTCGKCHPGATDNFVLGKVHLDIPTSQDTGGKAIRWIRLIYLTLIVLVVGGMLLHNGLIWRKKAAAIRGRQEREVIRMTRKQRVQHGLLIVCFAGLVITGFALKYPDSWVGALLGGNEVLRRGIHRVAAVVMLVVGAYHLGYLMLTKEGRHGFWDIFPRAKDVGDVWRNMAYYSGLSSRKPEFGRFSYAEKVEYWALVWGTIIMGITGLMIWFQLGAFAFLPRWVVEVAVAIHFYEAILATLAIVVWHFYQVIFDPDVYPLNWAFLDGRMSSTLYKEEHGLAYKEMIPRQPTGEPAAENTGNAADPSAEEPLKEG